MFWHALFTKGIDILLKVAMTLFDLFSLVFAAVLVFIKLTLLLIRYLN
jgi:hypothetical protein